MQHSDSSSALAIDELVAQFFDLFTNAKGQQPKVWEIHSLFIPQGVIIKKAGENTEVFDLDSFIQPRAEILTDGTLTDFSEWETGHQTEIRGTLASRICTYEKSGTYMGQPYRGTGTKMMQFIYKHGRWCFVSVIWSDDE